MEGLRQKLQAGRNASLHGYEKFSEAQYFENLTKEQYSGIHRPTFNALAVSKDSLNPLLSHERLTDRLAAIQKYRYIRGLEHTHWPHFLMTRAGQHLMKYKFNYGVKAFAAYIVYRDIAHYNHISSKAFLSYDQQAEIFLRTGAHSAILAALCLYI